MRTHRRIRVAVVLLAALALSVGLRGQAPGPAPILVVVNSAAPNPYGTYLAEILRAEGVTSVDVAQLSTLTAPTLASAKLVVLAETPLTAPQATLFVNYVAAGGRLVAMRPDAALAGTLGIAPVAATTTDGYVLIDQGGPGAGLQNVTLPFKGLAAHYTLAGASQVAALYSTRTTAAGRPAVMRFNRTATWSFDLARSTVYTRQGDPALAGLERDGDPPYRTLDLFYGKIDLERVSLPHADVQMRLFVRVVADLLADGLPLPRLWYFPGTAKTLFLPTADAHTNSLTAYQALVTTVEASGGRVTIYLPPFAPPTVDVPPATLAAWRAAGHEFGMHPVLGGVTVAQAYQTNVNWFVNSLLFPPSATTRHHEVAWQGWVDPVATMQANGVRMDTSYYAWGPTMFNPTQAQQAHGYVTGSGQPMRFVGTTGAVLPVYQQATALVDEQLVTGRMAEGLSTTSALAVSRQLIDDSQAGGYSAVTAQFHVDYYTFGEVRPWADGTMAYVQALGIPMWTMERWLRFTEARAGTQITDLAWSAGTRQLTFNVRVPAGAATQGLLLPATFQGYPLSQLTLGGQGVSPTPFVVSGQATMMLPLSDTGGTLRTVVVGYADPATLPVMSVIDGAANEGNAGTSTANITVSLSAAPATPVTVTYVVAAGTATADADVTPSNGVVTFPAGTTSRQIPIVVLGDLLDEPDETVIVTLTNAVGARAGHMSGVLTIVDDDQPPVAIDDVYATPFQVPLQVAAPGVLANDQNFGAPGLAAQLETAPENGTVALNANGSFTYTPNGDFGGPDVFTYRASNVTGVGPPATVAVNVAQPTTIQRPRNLRVFEMNGQVVTFRWTQGAGPTPVTYILEGGVLPGQTLAMFDVGRNLPLLTLTAPAGSFFVRVRGIANGILSAPSLEIPVHIGVPVPPSAPVPLQAAVNGTTVGLSWSNTFLGGAPLSAVLDVTGSAVTSIPVPVNETVAFGGVPAGTYTVSLREGNAGGASPSSAPITVSVPGTCAGALAAPRNPLFYTVGRTVYGVWDPPSSGIAATGYVLDVTGYGFFPTTGRRFVANAPPGSYSVAVRATNPCGVGVPSVFQTVVVP